MPYRSGTKRSFQAFWQDYEKTQTQPTTQRHSQQTTAAAQTQSDLKNTVTKLNKRKRIALRLLTLALLMLLGFIGWQFLPPKKVETITVELSTDKPTKPVGTKTTGNRPKRTERPYLQQIPKRQPPPITLNTSERQEIDTLQQWIINSLLALGLLAVTALWWIRRISFNSTSTQAKINQSLEYSVALQAIDKILIPDHKNTLARLRFDRLGQKTIQWPKTLSATAKQAGLPQLHYRQRQRQLDYLIISDHRHLRDQSAWLMQRLSTTLSEADIQVHYYDFDRYPEWLRRQGKPNDKPVLLKQVLNQYQNSRLILLSIMSCYFIGFRGEYSIGYKH